MHLFCFQIQFKAVYIRWSHDFLARIIVILFMLSLSNCTFYRHDGPPLFPIDVSKIPNAVPQYEPKSRSGNKDYVVRGKHYHVMKSAHHYKARGYASWYGNAFHHKHTSNGERYNMLSMAAAHKTLPLPTYLKVTNLHNGKHIIVKVIDRGPFSSKRIIDLSYVAAKKLDMIRHGTAYVEIAAIDMPKQLSQ